MVPFPPLLKSVSQPPYLRVLCLFWLLHEQTLRKRYRALKNNADKEEARMSLEEQRREMQSEVEKHKDEMQAKFDEKNKKVEEELQAKKMEMQAEVDGYKRELEAAGLASAPAATATATATAAAPASASPVRKGARWRGCCVLVVWFHSARLARCRVDQCLVASVYDRCLVRRR